MKNRITKATSSLGGGLTRFRCVFCKRICYSKSKLNDHMATCDARYIVRRGWANDIERAKIKEAKRNGDKER